jgi:ABC-2 type transport system ATP-binding protein
MEPILDLRHVRKAYEGFTLEDVSFSLPRGYIMGLVGPNGAGKTTLVRLILGLIRPDRGDIRVFGLDARRDEVAVRARIGFVHEVPHYYEHLSVEGAAAVVAPFYRTWDQGEFRRLVAAFDLPPRRRLRALSRGMRTKFALAVALAHRAELLLLDEPTSGLDPVFRRELLDRLSASIQGGDTAVLFSTHITADLERIADYVTFLERGRLVLSSTRDAIRERWALVKGDPARLDDDCRRRLRGLTITGVGFTGLTDDVAWARAHFGETAVIEPATLEDLVFHTSRATRGTPAVTDEPGGDQP